MAHVGAAIALTGETITLSQVIDPAQGSDQYTTPDPGKRFVGVQLTIKNTGSGALSDDANSEVSVKGSDNQSYTADFSSLSECTNFNSGSYNLAPGDSVSGCVAFQLPTGVTTKQVQFTSQSGLSDTTAQWLVP